MQKKYPIDVLIEELEKIFGKHGIKEGSSKTGSFVYIPAKKKPVQDVKTNSHLPQENEHEQEKGNISPIDLFGTDGELP